MSTLKTGSDAQSVKLSRGVMMIPPGAVNNLVMVSRVVAHVSVGHVAHVAPGAGAVSPVSDHVTVAPISQTTQVLVTLQRVMMVTEGDLGQEAGPLILLEDGVAVERPGRGRRWGHDT